MFFYILFSSRAPTNSSTIIHLLPLPHSARADGVRLRWSQEAPQGPEGYESCWGMDNVLLVNAAHRTPLMEENLDPPDTANWLFFPGATVKVHESINAYSRILFPSHLLRNVVKCSDRLRLYKIILDILSKKLQQLQYESNK